MDKEHSTNKLVFSFLTVCCCEGLSESYCPLSVWHNQKCGYMTIRGHTQITVDTSNRKCANKTCENKDTPRRYKRLMCENTSGLKSHV